MPQKRLFRVTGNIKGIGPVETYRWAHSPEQTVKLIVLYYQTLHPELHIFIENREVYEKNGYEWVQVLP